eukprot:g4552.t1
MKQSCFQFPNQKLFEKLPKWLPAFITLFSLSVVLNSISGDIDSRVVFSSTNSIVWYAAICLNITLLATGLFSLSKTALSAWETWNEAKTFIDRVWKITTHGPMSAGVVGEDLGEADEHGVYVRRTWTGARLFLRMTQPSYSEDSVTETWQWSFDKEHWTPVAKAGCFLLDRHTSAGIADRILMRRLDVETAFRKKQRVPNSVVQLPAIELGSMTLREQKRLTQLTPRSFLCPISMELMTEPVICPSGVTYDRKSITQWIEEHHSDPATKASMKTDDLYPNLTLRDMIQEWLVDNKFTTSHGRH